MTFKNDESHALIYTSLYIIPVKDMATHCLPAFCLNFLGRAHIVLLGPTTSYIVGPGFLQQLHRLPFSTTVEHTYPL